MKIAFRNEKKLEKKSSNNVLEVKTHSRTNNGVKVITVQKKKIIFYFSPPKGVYRSTFYPICKSYRSGRILTRTNDLPDTYFGLIQYQYDILKVEPKTCLKSELC